MLVVGMSAESWLLVYIKKKKIKHPVPQEGMEL